MDGEVSWLGTVHTILTLNFISTWILPLHVVFSAHIFVMVMEQHPSSAATRVTEHPFLGSTLLTSSGLEKVAQALPVPPFPGSFPQPQGYPTCGRTKYTVNSSIKQQSLVVTCWNVRTLQDTGLGARRRTALIACELARYNIGIAALSEARHPMKVPL